MWDNGEFYRFQYAGNYSELVCDNQHPQDVYILSHLCVEGTEEDFLSLPCAPKNLSISRRYMAGVWGVINTTIGIFGNFLTLFAVPYAAHKKRHGFHKNMRTQTVFILYLSFSDVLYCIFCMPSYLFAYLGHQWPFGVFLCGAALAFTLATAYADWLILGVIAMTRCIGMIKPVFWDSFCTKRNLAFIFLGVWVWVILIMVPLFIDDSLMFGYNCMMGKCDIIPTGLNSTLSDIVIKISPNALAFVVPCSLVVINYAIIWYYVWSSSRYLKRNKNVREQLNKRDLKMTWTILTVFLCYAMCVAPLTIILVLEMRSETAFLVTICIYWGQYSLNFIIYAVMSEQYRKAYLDFLALCWSWIKDPCGFRARSSMRRPITTNVVIIIKKDMLPPAIKVKANLAKGSSVGVVVNTRTTGASSIDVKISNSGRNPDSVRMERMQPSVEDQGNDRQFHDINLSVMASPDLPSTIVIASCMGGRNLKRSSSTTDLDQFVALDETFDVRIEADIDNHYIGDIESKLEANGMSEILSGSAVASSSYVSSTGNHSMVTEDNRILIRSRDDKLSIFASPQGPDSGQGQGQKGQGRRHQLRRSNSYTL